MPLSNEEISKLVNQGGSPAMAESPSGSLTDQQIADMVNAPEGDLSRLMLGKPIKKKPVGGFLGYLPGGVGDAVESARDYILSPAAGAIRSMAPEVKPSIQSRSVLLNILSGLPSLAASVPAEFAAQEVEQLPETLALGGAGKIGKATGAFKGLGKLVGKVDAPLARWTKGHFTLGFRGGHSVAGKKLFGAFDEGQVSAENAAGDVKRLLTTNPAGKAYSTEEQRFIGQLMEQPGQRRVLLPVTGEQEVNAALKARFAGSAKKVPGVTGSAAQARLTPFPETDLPLGHYAEVADTAEAQLQQTWKRLSKELGEDPAAASRFFANAGYNPRVYAGARTGVWAGVTKRGIRERGKDALKKRLAQTDEDRITKGLIQEPGAPVSLRIAQEQRLANTRSLFNGIAANPSLVFDDPTLLRATEAGKMVQVGKEWFKKMATDEALGPLSGRLVRAAEANEIDMLVRSQSNLGKNIRSWWSAWKFGKTVANPKTHIRNFTSNTMMAHAAGLSPYRLDIYRGALKELVAGKGMWWDEARKFNAPWTSLRGTGLEEVIDDKALREAGSAFEAFMLKLPNWLMRNKTSAKMAELYSQSEALFKHAVYINMRRKGIGPQEAMQKAGDAIIDYGKMPQWVKWARSTPIGVPFVSFTYGVVPRIAQTALERPQLFQHYKIAADSWNAVAKEAAGVTDEESQAIDDLFPGTVPMIMPYRSETGSAMVFDVARFTPVSDFIPDRLDMTGTPVIGGALGGLVGNIAGKNPLLQWYAGQASGVDPFFKSQLFPMEKPGARAAAKHRGLTDDTEVMKMLFGSVSEEEAAGRLKHTGRAVLPPWLSTVLPGGGVNEAVRGGETFLGETPSIKRALLEEILGPTRSLDNAEMFGDMALDAQEKEAGKALGTRIRKGKE